jgi:hypothetical protein
MMPPRAVRKGQTGGLATAVGDVLRRHRIGRAAYRADVIGLRLHDADALFSESLARWILLTGAPI